MCEICAEISGIANADRLAGLLGGSYRRRVLAEWATMAVLPSIGPLVDGHVLICPKRHVNRMAGLADQEWTQLNAAKARVSDVLGEVYGVRPQFFEHGSSADGARVPCTVSHAHLHVVPVDQLWGILPNSVSWRAFDVEADSLDSAGGEGEYLYYEDDTGRAAVGLSTLPIESQLLRQVIARLVGNPSRWNWRDFPEVESLRRTCKDLELAFAAPVIRKSFVG